jgi:hypothetical protein
MLSAKEGGREPQCTKSAVPARFLAETTQGSAGKSVAHATLLKVSGVIFCLTCGPAKLGVLQPAAPHAPPSLVSPASWRRRASSGPALPNTLDPQKNYQASPTCGPALPPAPPQTTKSAPTCGPAQLGVLQPAAPHALPITHQPRQLAPQGQQRLCTAQQRRHDVEALRPAQALGALVTAQACGLLRWGGDQDSVHAMCQQQHPALGLVQLNRI